MTSKTMPTSPDVIRARINDNLAAFFAARRTQIALIDEPTTAYTDMIADFSLTGGKRVRPLFAWAGYLGAGGSEEDVDAVLRAFSALELIQACALIHDDIIDASDMRRGNPTIHRRVEAIHSSHSWSGSAERYGFSVAILLGDLALTWADDMLNESGLSAAALRRVHTPWAAMRTEVITGQILDIASEAACDEAIESANKINLFKTAAYTIERPLHLGAAIAGATDELVDAYRTIGRHLGVAYQLRDDLLGVFGDPSVTGKPAGDDLREGKRTVLLATALRYLDAHDPAQAHFVRTRIGHCPDADTVDKLTRIIESTDAVAVAEREITRLTDTAFRTIESSGMTTQGRELLERLADRATQRHA